MKKEIQNIEYRMPNVECRSKYSSALQPLYLPLAWSLRLIACSCIPVFAFSLRPSAVFVFGFRPSAFGLPL